MISYYKFNNTYFKLDDEKTLFQHVNNTSEEKIVVGGTKNQTIQAMHNSKDRDNWEVVTEEEYNTAKAEVIAALSVI